MNYEQEVKKVYPMAVRSLYYAPDSGSWFIVHDGNTELSSVRPDGIDAWQSAYNSIYPLPLSRIANTTCYIQFDNNIQLQEFMEQHELHPYMGITRTDLYVYFINGETIATAEPRDTTAIIYHINQIK